MLLLLCFNCCPLIELQDIFLFPKNKAQLLRKRLAATNGEIILGNKIWLVWSGMVKMVKMIIDAIKRSMLRQPLMLASIRDPFVIIRKDFFFLSMMIQET